MVFVIPALKGRIYVYRTRQTCRRPADLLTITNKLVWIIADPVNHGQLMPNPTFVSVCRLMYNPKLQEHGSEVFTACKGCIGL